MILLTLLALAAWTITVEDRRNRTRLRRSPDLLARYGFRPWKGADQ